MPKDLDLFPKKGTGTASYCKECQREYSRCHYRLNKEAHIQRKCFYQREIRRPQLRAFINSLKGGPCMDCGGSFNPWVMQFDHVRGIKEMDVTNMSNSKSKASILAETEKCELVCSNCHAERTHQRRVASKK